MGTMDRNKNRDIQATLSSEELYNNVSHKRFFFFLTVPFLDFFQREGASAKVFLGNKLNGLIWHNENFDKN